VRWESLFADLEAQFAAAEDAELVGEIADRTRREAATIRLADRLRGATGSLVRVHLRGGVTLTAVVGRVGNDWLLLEEPTGPEHVIVLDALTGVYGLPLAAAKSNGAVAARLGLGYVLRAIARDRLPVTVHLVDGSTTTGTIDRVGKDYFELAEHPDADVRRSTGVRTVRLIPFAGFAALRRA
jgi:sRNA-binding regulator protein Hfq